MRGPLGHGPENEELHAACFDVDVQLLDIQGVFLTAVGPLPRGIYV